MGGDTETNRLQAPKRKTPPPTDGEDTDHSHTGVKGETQSLEQKTQTPQIVHPLNIKIN